MGGALAADFEATDLAPAIGAEVRADRESLLAGRFAKEIRALLERRGVVIFRDMPLDDAQQKAFTQTLGALAPQRGLEVVDISLDRAVNPRDAENFRSTVHWHIDTINTPLPNLAVMLAAQQVSEVGGETEFANTYAAWDELPDAEKAAYDGLRVVHAHEAAQLMITPEPSLAQLEHWRTYGRAEQPLVWTHRSGRKSLAISSSAMYVVGKSPEDSRYILTRLRDWATQRRYVYQHSWRRGDLVIWDNTGTMHRVLPYRQDSGRLLRRTALEGEEPFA
jgi:alpha-ketoglutarate-dependent taurine dioxygenase